MNDIEIVEMNDYDGDIETIPDYQGAIEPLE